MHKTSTVTSSMQVIPVAADKSLQVQKNLGQQPAATSLKYHLDELHSLRSKVTCLCLFFSRGEWCGSGRHLLQTEETDSSSWQNTTNKNRDEIDCESQNIQACLEPLERVLSMHVRKSMRGGWFLTFVECFQYDTHTWDPITQNKPWKLKIEP